MATKGYDYNEETGFQVEDPRAIFSAAVINARSGRIEFPFEQRYSNTSGSEPFDTYICKDINPSFIYVIGSSCHYDNNFNSFEDSIAILCEPDKKKTILKRISKVIEQI